MQTGKYLAGYAKLDITPFIGCRIIDLGKDVVGTGVLDPLYVRAIAFSDGEKKSVIMVLDNWIGVPDYLEWIPKLAKELNMDEESINYFATHSHATPCISENEEYDAFVYHRMKDAITIALDDLKPVTDVMWTDERAEGFFHTRRYRMVDGAVHTNPVRRERRIVAPAENFDDTMRVIRILRQGGKEIDIINGQAHPNNGSSLRYTASYPGLLCANFERMNDDAECLYLNGAEGDMITRGPEPFELGKDAEWDIDYSFRLAKLATEMRGRAVSTETEGFSFKKGGVTVKTKRDPSRLEEAKRIRELFNSGRRDEIDPDPKEALNKGAEAGNIVWLEETGEYTRDVPLTVIGFCGVAIAGICGEPFSQVGINIREASPFKTTCIGCFANGGKGYFPTEEAYKNGGYESHNTPIAIGAAELITEETIKLLNEI